MPTVPKPVPKTAEQIEKMRVAGRLAASVLEMIGEHVKAGVTTEELNRRCHDYIVNDIDCVAGAAQLYERARPTTVSKVHLHVGQSGRLPRHSIGQEKTQERRRDQHRRHGHQGWLARRYEQDVFRRQTGRAGGTPGARDARVPVQGHRNCSFRCASRRYRRGHSNARPGQPLLRSPRILRSRHRQDIPRLAAGPALWPARFRRGPSGGHDLHHRAHDQCRQARRESATRLLDRSDEGITSCRRSGSTPSLSPRPAPKS